MKKLIAILLACILLAAMLLVTGCDGLFPGTGDDAGNNGDSNGDDDNTGGSGDNLPSTVSDLEFELNDDQNSYTMTKYNGSQASVIIPSKYLDKPVTSIGNYAFSDCSSFTSITIPDSVTSIGNSAFSGCSSLTSVTIPDNVTSIGYNAFADCDRLTSITIPNSVTSIGNRAFYRCSSLTSITIPNSVTSIGSYAFYYTGYYNDEANWENGVLYIGKYLIEAKTSISGSYAIKDGTLLITPSAFWGCSSLTSVTIPDGVTSIGDAAFYGCSNLTSIAIPDSVTSIGSYAFSGCSGLESITVAEGNSKYHSAGNCLIETESKTLILGCKNSVIPDDGSVTSIGEGAFYGCSSLKSITIPNSVTSIGSSAFDNCSSLTSVTIGDSVTSIGRSAFYECSANLESITVAEGNSKYHSAGNCLIETESKTLILGCKNSVIPDDGSVTSIGREAFCYCSSSLTSITIPDSVTSIGNYAFDNCSSLTSVTIGDSVTSIGSYAFSGCSSLTSITIPNSVTSIGSSAFYNCISLTSITIPDSVTSIESFAFLSCSSLKSITIGDSVTSIGSDAFRGCSSLTNIIIPNSVMDIGRHAFEYCYKLVEVYNFSSLEITKDSSSNGYVGYYALNVYTPTSGESKLWTDEDGYIFYEDGDICYLMGYTGDDTELTLPNSCNGKNYSIYNYAFYYCSRLTSVTIPNSVTSIGDDAFYDCYKLVEVYNLSSLEITKGSSDNGCVERYALDIYTDVNAKSKLWTDENGYIFYEDGDTCYLIEYTGKDTELTLPDSCNGKDYGIYKYAFRDCSSLTSVTIPDSVTSIGNYAFYHCSSLTSITIPDSVTSIGRDAFWCCSRLTSVTIPNSVTSIGSSAFSHTEYYKDESNWENGVLYIGKYLIEAKTSISSSYTIKDGTLCIAGGAFSQCSSLTSITIPDSVTSIGSDAFYYCSSLTSVTIGDSVTSIGSCVFSYCSSLTTINYTGSNGEWNAISMSYDWDYRTGSYTIVYNYAEE